MARVKWNQKRVEIEARRAKVAELLLRRLSYRDIGAMLDVTDATVAGDVKYLRTQWAKTHGQLDSIFERAAMDQDTLQNKILEAMENVAPEDTPAFFGRIITLMDQRNRLHGLYPKNGANEASDIPTGPITLDIRIIEPGNKQLIVDEGGQHGEEELN